MLFQSKESTSVLDMLKADHKKLKELFEQFENEEEKAAKQQIANSAIAELEVHAALEEEIIYPAMRPEIDDDELMDEAWEEHHVAHVLINELKKMKSGEGRFDAKFTVLAENVKHHIEEEESELFPKAEDTEIDWEALEGEVLQRREQLTAKNPARQGGNGRASQKNGKGKRTSREKAKARA